MFCMNLFSFDLNVLVTIGTSEDEIYIITNFKYTKKLYTK